MAARSWAGSSLTAAGVAAGAGAAQLGLGYGLGIVAWQPPEATEGRVPWLASLAWVVWLAGSSTVLGAIIAHRLAGRGRPEPEPEGMLLVAWRATLVVSAAIGALVIVPLVAVPARTAETGQNFAPEWTAAGYVVVGVVVGIVVAAGALVARSVAVNALATVGYLWVLAVAAVVDGLRRSDEPLLVQLSMWEFNDGPQIRGFYVPGVLLMLLVAAAIGFGAAWPFGRRGDSRVGVAVSGATGPSLVAAAYLLAAPQFAGEDNVDVSQWSAAMFAPYAVLAGLAGSVLVAAIGPPLTADERLERTLQAEERRSTRAAERDTRRQAADEAKAARRQEAEAAKAAKRQAADEAKAADQAAKATAKADRDAARAEAKAAKETEKAAGKAAVGNAAVKPAPAQRSDDDDLAGWPPKDDDGLADDAYAPSRAYRDSESGDDEPKGEQKPPPKPLWPKGTGGGSDGQDPNRRGRGRGRR